MQIPSKVVLFFWSRYKSGIPSYRWKQWYCHPPITSPIQWRLHSSKTWYSLLSFTVSHDILKSFITNNNWILILFWPSPHSFLPLTKSGAFPAHPYGILIYLAHPRTSILGGYWPVLPVFTRPTNVFSDWRSHTSWCYLFWHFISLQRWILQSNYRFGIPRMGVCNFSIYESTGGGTYVRESGDILCISI